MASTRISDIAREMGVESRELIKWARETGLDVSRGSSTLSDAEEERLLEHLYSVTHKLAAGWGHAMVDVLRKIEQRLPPTPTTDPDSERRFLLLREALGPRGSIDPARPVILKDVFTYEGPLLPATARWCDGAVVNLTWVGLKPTEKYEVTFAQSERSAYTSWPLDTDRFEPEGFDEWQPLDEIVVRLSEKVIAAGGPIDPWAKRC